MKRKTIGSVQIKDVAQGTVRAVFSTLNVVDLDGDVTLPGAFTDGAEVRISAYNHASWGPGALPVGKGTISEQGDEAILDGEFFLNTAAGADTFETVKQLGSLGEWSYGYDVVEESEGTQEGQPVNFLKDLTVHEVSPVILGAGVNTRTLAAKGKQLAYDVFERLRDAGRERWATDDAYVYVDDFDVDASWAVFCVLPDDEAERHVRVEFSREGDDGAVVLGSVETEVQRRTEYAPKGRRTLSDRLVAVVADVKSVTDEYARVVALRAEKGRSPGAATVAAATELEPTLRKLVDLLDVDEAEQDTVAETLGDGALEIEAELAEHAARIRI